MKISNGKSFLKEIVQPQNFPNRSLFEYRSDDPNFVKDLVDSISDLIAKNLVLLSPLKTIYRFVFNTARVIMRINDVQCSKGQKYKERKLNRFLISTDGKKLAFTSVEKPTYDKAELALPKRIKSNYRLTVFDFMDHIYGPNDSDDMMTQKINQGFLNLLKSYDGEQAPSRLTKDELATVYFTYGFSGSGKTYNTNKIISSLIEFLAKKYDPLKEVKIRYGEIGALTTEAKDLLMSGKQFTGTIQNHTDWADVESDEPNTNIFREDMIPFYYEKPLSKKKPLILKEDWDKVMESTKSKFTENDDKKDFRNLMIKYKDFFEEVPSPESALQIKYDAGTKNGSVLYV